MAMFFHRRGLAATLARTGVTAAFVNAMLRPAGASAAFSSSVASSIDVASLQLTRTETPKTKPPFDHTLPFGGVTSDHMMEVDWAISSGFTAPRIVPVHPLSILPTAPALHYGVQCFEGMKAYRGKDGTVRLFRPDKNMARWNRSCERLALPTFDSDAMIACLKKLVEVDQDWVPDKEGFSLYLRPTALGTDNVLSVHPSESALFFIITCPVGPYFKNGFAPVKILAETSFKRAWPGGMGGHKVGGNYAPGMLPQRLAQEAGYAQVLWLFGDEDIVTEVGSMNLFTHWITPEGKEQLITAPLDGTILPGVTRDSILELAREWGDCEVVEGTYTMPEVAKAAAEGRLLEVFGAGTAAVISPVELIGYKGEDIKVPCGADGKVGPLAAKIHKTLTDIHYGRTEFRGWSVPIN